MTDYVASAKENFKEILCHSLSDHKSSSKNYWHIIKQLLGNKFSSDIPTLDHNGVTLSDDKLKSSAFLNHFISKFHHSHNEMTVPYCRPKTNVILNNIEISREAINKQLKQLDTSKSGGVDGLSHRMLNMVADSIDEPLFK